MDSLYVVDVARFATLVQYDPLVDLRVLPIGDATARQILKDNSSLELDLKALRSMVHLFLYQSYEIKIQDRYAVWAAMLSP